MKRLSYIETDLRYCSLTYGESPCTAQEKTGEYTLINVGGNKTPESETGIENHSDTYGFSYEILGTPGEAVATGSSIQLYSELLEIFNAQTGPNGAHLVLSNGNLEFRLINQIEGGAAIVTGSDGDHPLFSNLSGFVSRTDIDITIPKCHNTPATCQDPENFTLETKTIRFVKSCGYEPQEIEAFPAILSISIQPQELAPGESLGNRESISVDLGDFLFNGVGIDKYIEDRGFDTYQKSSFWPKFKSIWPFIQGSKLRYISGELGQSLGEMETRHYIIESTSGPDKNHNFRIVAKDPIKIFDDDKAQAPRASNGILSSPIDGDDTSLTLSPSGIGNLEYPESGIASIGDEQVSFTRSGDAITLTGRGLDGSEASDHDEGETFQIGIFYDGEDPADIIYDLVTEYTNTDPSMIPLDDWYVETSFIGRQYSAKILKPTGVKTLINELINQVGLIIYSDIETNQIILRALRQFSALTTYSDDDFIENSFDIKEQPEKRVSVPYIYYGQKNPLESVEDEKNYRVILPFIGETPVSVLEDRQIAFRKIFSRWITTINRPAAEALAQSIVARYVDAPNKYPFKLPISRKPVLAGAANIMNKRLVDANGDPVSKLAQIISVKKNEADYDVVAEEMRFTQQAVTTERLIYIDQDTFNFNLRTAHDQIYADPVGTETVICVIRPGVFLGYDFTTDNNRACFDVGLWPDGVSITVIINQARFQGAGGIGAWYNGVPPPQLIGFPGQKAFYTRYPVTIDNQGEIFGGGGGGGGSISSGQYYGGGGGAGNIPGLSLSGGQSGTKDSGGVGRQSSGSVRGGTGGDPGENGESGVGPTSGAGGAAGPAIDGESYITWINEGDIRGPRIN